MPSCPVCGSELRKPSRGPFPTYCSGTCRARACDARAAVDGRLGEWREKANLARRSPRTTKVCPYCLSEFDTARPDQVRCPLPECGRAHAAKLQREGKYVTKYRRKHGRNPGSLAADARRRDAVVKGEPFRRIDVFERDGWVCWLCDGSVPRDAKWPDSDSASMDHVVPVSLGGPHDFGNVRTAHLGCNSARGNRDIAHASEASRGA